MFLFGQFIAFLASFQNVISYELASRMGLAAPMFLMCPAYLILSMTHLFAGPPRDEGDRPYRIPLTSINIRVPFSYYVGLSILDVFPNYMILVALRHTSLTSVTLLGSLTVPSTMLACSLLLGQRFQIKHYFGVVCCVGGGMVAVLGDANRAELLQFWTESVPATSFRAITL